MIWLQGPVVIIYTTSLTFTKSTFCPHSVFMCFVWIWEQTTIISLYSINWLVFITKTVCVYCAVRTGSLYITLGSAHSVFMCFVWIWEQEAIISLYSRSVSLSARMEQLCTLWTDFYEICCLNIFRKICPENSSFIKNLTIITGTLHEGQFTFLISRSVLLRMRNISDKSCIGNENTHFVLSNFFSFKNCTVYEKIWKNVVQRGRPQMAIWRMRTACWLPKSYKHTHRLCNTHCFSTTAMVARTRLCVMLYVHRLSCYNWDGECLLRGTSWVCII